MNKVVSAMRWLLACALVTAGAHAQEMVALYPLVVRTNFVNPGSNVTATTSFTNYVDIGNNLYHTFASYNTATGTNTVTGKWYRTLDNTNYLQFATNQFTATGVYETNFTGTWRRLKCELTVAATNASASCWYQGHP